MAGNDGAPSIQGCAMRISRLAADGTTPAGASNSIVSQQLIKLERKTVQEAGNDFTVKNACGGIAVAYKDRDRLKRFDLNLSVTAPDPEMEEMLTGASLITAGGQTIGASAPAVGSDISNGVCLEIWSKAWIGGGEPPGQVFADGVTTNADATLTSASAAFSSADVGRTITGAGIPGGTTILSVTNATTVELSANATASASGVSITIGRPGKYHLWVFPWCEFSLGDSSIENAPMSVGFAGPTYENPNIGNGPFNDWPATANGGRSYSHWRVSSIPSVSTVGYQATPTQS